MADLPLTYDKLDPDAQNAQLKTLDGWSIDDGALTKAFEFESYKDGVVFASAVGWAADSLNHHPDLLVGYQKVTVTLVTHDAGGGLTAYDFELARRIDRIGQ